ncbi:hypothetical protein JY651_05345 [Pyxidicoccus parkwayensis]|uniref:Secreted protein n=1 Tax=Pyxidicoccus parkwayensis TaxID=2813578 RepID=A0ABX7P0U8_9BACT|nr:hypothetical protein [Pyxidicoccus parkwaysis]QSQ24388.1 hypothetical protein JY651_05345 [Pyxidicoccus parkwaysis]
MRRIAWLCVLLSAAVAGGVLHENSSHAGASFNVLPKEPGVYPVDTQGNLIDALPIGQSLHVGVVGLQPNTVYEFRMGVDQSELPDLERAVGFARATTDARGQIQPFILWYQSGVVGCNDRPRFQDAPFRFRDFDKATEALDGHTLTVSVHAVARDERGDTPPMKLPVGPAEATFRLPLKKVTDAPLVFASNDTGCLLNASETSKSDMYVSGRGFEPGEALEVAVVPNQRAWRVGDTLTDVSGENAAPEIERVFADTSGRFTVPVWKASLQRRGVYDIVVRRLKFEPPQGQLGTWDVVSYGIDTGYVLYLIYPIGGPTMDIAGRPLVGFPYYEFSDAFADTNDPVWGAVDPTYVPAGHTGGTWAAYYVVNHRDPFQWALNNTLVDVSGGIEIHPVKAGCVNGTDTIIWNAPLNEGKYDVVVDFGSTVANTAAAYSTDGQYNSAIDFLDGSNQIGFQVGKDPYDLGTFPIGQDSYSTDDFFPTIGAASNVDLRAVIRYPATVAGVGTPVAAGTHPIFIMEHGNHGFCRNAGQTHATCTNRVRNHEGYMRLLDTLASHGIIAVSIDAYDLTGPVPQWIFERGTLILKHLELWSHLNNAATFPTYPNYFSGRFNGKLDMTKISVSGHSRGGEASVAAYMLNTTFNIGSVSSIAPVDGQGYTLPAGVPYFVILPSADGDVSNLAGARIYDRALGTKSSIDVYGASHNLFNTVWAADGDDSPGTRQDYITATNQQRIGEAWLAAFTRLHLNNETVYADMMRGQLVFPSFAGFKIYPTHHENQHSRLSSGASADFAGAGALTMANVTNPAPHQTQVVRMNWTAGTATATRTVPVAQRDTTGLEVVAFRVARTTSALNPVSGSQDFTVELVGAGITRGTTVAKFDTIPKPYPHPYGFTHTVLTSVRVPLHSFIMNNSGLPLNNVDTVRFTFNGPNTGEIYVDDVEFSR